MKPDLAQLPPKQRQVLDVILAFLRENGYPPSIQQLCDRCGVSSTSTIHYHVSALKKKGFIHWNPAEKRAISVHNDLRDRLEPAGQPEDFGQQAPSRGIVPLLGTIAAGSPLQTLQDDVEAINLSADLCPPGCYALRVRGDSMIEDHILDGDIVLVDPKSAIRNGDMVVALIEGETATLKRFYKEKDAIRLQPANASMDPIFVRDVQVQGKVEAVIRKLF